MGAIRHSFKQVQIVQPTADGIGTWCRINDDNGLEIGWGRIGSNYPPFRNPQITLSEDAVRMLTQFVVEHFPLDALAGIPLDD